MCVYIYVNICVYLCVCVYVNLHNLYNVAHIYIFKTDHLGLYMQMLFSLMKVNISFSLNITYLPVNLYVWLKSQTTYSTLACVSLLSLFRYCLDSFIDCTYRCKF